MRIFFLKAGCVIAIVAAVFIVGCAGKQNEPFESVTTSI